MMQIYKNTESLDKIPVKTSGSSHVCTGSKCANLDTLAQLRTFDKKEGYKSLQKRALSKWLTNELLFPLIDLESPLNKSYWNSYYCVRHLIQSKDGSVTSKYCKNRWCIVCNRIRTAKLIKGYEPSIAEFPNPQFVTLTLPNVSGSELADTLNHMSLSYRKIMEGTRKHKDINPQGIRKTEVTYNDKTGLYHPHYHLIVNNLPESEHIVSRWLKLIPEANIKGQDIRKSTDGSTIELFKYFTKLYKKGDDGVVQPYAPEVMDTIFRILKNKRVVQPFGSVKAVSSDFESLEATVFLEENRQIIWEWIHDARTWIDLETGEMRVEPLEPLKPLNQK